MNNIFQYVNIKYGEGTIKEIKTFLDECHSKKAFLICDPIMVQNGTADKLVAYSNGAIVQVSGDVRENADIEKLDINTKLAKEAGADTIIGMGGGSTMDLAKLVAVCIADNVTGEDLLAGGDLSKAHVVQNSLPVIAIPTTAGTGSEITKAAAICDLEKNIHSGVESVKMFPTISVVDPELTYSMPKSVTVNTGLDAMAHAIDAIGGVLHNNYSDALALKAVKMVLDNIEKAVEGGDDNHEARRNMSEAAFIAGLALNQTVITGIHACATAVSAVLHLPHGAACAFVLDDWILLFAKARPEINGFAQQLGFADAQALASHVKELKIRLGVRNTISACNLDEHVIPILVDISMNFYSMNMSIYKPTREELFSLYQAHL